MKAFLADAMRGVLCGFLIGLLAAAGVLASGCFAHAGCYSYPSYRSYSYSYPSYSYPSYSYSYPSYSYPQYIEKIRYVEKPVYVAQYSPLLVTVPSYSIGYTAPSPCVQTASLSAQAPAAAAPVQAAVQQPVQQQTAVQQTQAAVQQQAAAAAVPQVPPCEQKLIECQTRLSRMEAQLSVLIQQRQSYSQPPYQQPAAQPPQSLAPSQERREQTPAQVSALQVFADKCSMCHDDRNAKDRGGNFVLLKLTPENRYAPAQLTPEDWGKILEQISSGKMPKKPAEASQDDFDRNGRLTQNELWAVISECRRYLQKAPPMPLPMPPSTP